MRRFRQQIEAVQGHDAPRRQCSHQCPHQGGLACAIAPDQAGELPFAERQLCVADDLDGADRDVQRGNLKHRTLCWR
jgi:hypothetical protein